MFASELKNIIELESNVHFIWCRTSGEGNQAPAEMKILVPYFKEDGTFYGYGEANAYYDPQLGGLIIEQIYQGTVAQLVER
jgi:hypothetical protein